ncbi:MAG TPA: sulfotransferase [Kofleriaceae bacterium]|nr:sulfotransferase [Kofleriaceae bacterium]
MRRDIEDGMEHTVISGPKIFCIGFHKTASSSLAAALEILLGARVCGPVGHLRPDIADRYRALAREVLDDYVAFKDNPWTILYRDLDRWCPNSKFILTVRDSWKWLQSVVRNFGGQSTPMRELLYGAGRGDPVGNEDLYISRYERHNLEVRQYFEGRSDLLIMDITRGDGWDPLCRFLGRSRPAVEFPSVNITSEREAGKENTYKVLRFPYGKGRGGDGA